MRNNGRKNHAAWACMAFAAFMALMPAYSAKAPMHRVYAAQASETNDSKLSAFDIAPGDLSPAFSPDVTSYTSTVDEGVTSVSVQAVPRSANGSIASVEGAKNLQPGVNTITVICSAPDQSYTTYTISLTVGSAAGATEAVQPEETEASQPSDTETAQPANTENAQPSVAEAQMPADTAASQPSDGQNDDALVGEIDVESAASGLVGAVNADGTAELNGASYTLSNNFSYEGITQDIPSAFVPSSVSIGENKYQTLTCKQNGIQLVYMQNTAGDGSTGFYFYDELQNTVERFKYMGSGDQFVVFINNGRQEVPDGYESTSFTLPSGKDVAAYQNLANGAMQDFYLIYGIYSDGTSGWYLFDSKQNTYMRYVDHAAMAVSEQGEASAEGGEEIERTVSLDKYNALYEKYQKGKNNLVKIVSGLVIVLVLLIILFTAILLRGQGGEEDEAVQEEKERARAKKQLKRAKKHAQNTNKHSLEKGREFGTKLSRREKEPEVTTIHSVDELPSGKEEASSQRTEHDQVREEPKEAGWREQPSGQPRRDAMDGYTQSQRRRGQGQRSSLLKPDVNTEESVQIAAEKMRQSVQRTKNNQNSLHRNPVDGIEEEKRTMSVQSREEMFRPTTRIRVEEDKKDALDDWEQEEAAVNRKRSKKKKPVEDDGDVEIMDLNDL